MRVDLKGVEILFEEERSVNCVFSVDFGKEVFFGVGIETKLFHGLIFGYVSNTILEFGTVNDALQIRPDRDVFLNTHLGMFQFVSKARCYFYNRECLELFILRLV